MRQYLAASETYLLAKAERRAKRNSMPFPFPNVGAKCLLCDAPGCARWKGYEVRGLICAEYGHAGPVAIHVGHCRTRKKDFLYFPDFLIAGRRLSRPTLKSFAETFAATGEIKMCIDDLIEHIEGDDFAIALSSAYEWIYATIRALRLNAGRLAIQVSEVTSVAVMRSVSSSALSDLFESRYAWHPYHDMVLHPP